MSVNPGIRARKKFISRVHSHKNQGRLPGSPVNFPRTFHFRIEVDGGVTLDTVGRRGGRAGGGVASCGQTPSFRAKATFGKNARKLLEAARAATLTRA